VYALGGQGQHGAAAGAPGPARIGALLTLFRPLVVGSWWELVPAVLVAVVLAGLARTALRRGPGSGPGTDDARAPVDPAVADRWVLGAGTVVATLAFLLSPEKLGEEYGFLPDRLVWFPVLLLVLFCATRPPGRTAVQRATAGCLVLAASAAVAVRLPTQLQDQRLATELLSVADELPPGATFAVLRFSGHEAALAPLSRGPDPLRHLSGRLAVAVHGVDVGHYEALLPYFQVRFTPAPGVRRAIDPGGHGLEEVPPAVDLAAAGNDLDYVLVTGLDRAGDAVRQAPRTARVLADLHAGYEQVAVSRPSGYVSVWRLRNVIGG
jgi:hypothetical protein